MGQAMNKQIGRGPAHLWLSNALDFPHSIINGFSSFVISQETIIKKRIVSIRVHRGRLVFPEVRLLNVFYQISDFR